MEQPEDSDLQRQIDELVARVTANRADIDALRSRAAAAEERAAASNARAEVAERQADEDRASIDALRSRADAFKKRADAGDRRADVAQARADAMEARWAIDHELIAELQADGVVSREHVAQLEKALVTSRTIGAAVGVLMASRHIGQAEALTVLKEASSRSNTPMRHLAEIILAGPEAIR